ncbi:MAG: molecular chaperone [Haloferacaceae archaeon]
MSDGVDDAAVYDARLELVDFLIEVFADAPSEAFVERLLAGTVAVPDEPVNEPMDEGFDRLEAFVAANRKRDPADVADDLTTAYTRLFVGPRPPVLPHETYYREDTEFVGEGLAEVEASYGGAGWTPPEDYPEESDHVAVELAFLRYLIERQRSGDEEAFGFERVFLDEHLLVWVDEFVDDLCGEADEGLFAAAALVFAGTVEFEDELVAQMVPGPG